MASVIEIHPDNGLPMVEAGGEFRVLGALPSPKTGAFGASYQDHFELTPRSQWKPFSLRAWAAARRDQHASSCCTGYASTTAARLARRLAGLPDVALSPFFVYGLINGGRDAGAQVSDTMAVLAQRGACREELMPELQKGTYQASQYTKAQYDDAAKHKIWRALRLTSFDDVGSALTRGLLCVTGVAVGKNFQAMSSKGVCPIPDVVIGGHALPLIGLESTSQYGWCPETENSWTNQWGDDGFAFLQEGYWDPKYGFTFDTYAILSPDDDPSASDDPVA